MVIFLIGCGTESGEEEIKHSLPSVKEWKMNEIKLTDSNIKRGAYQKGNSVVILDTITGKSLNSIKNILLSRANEIIEKETKSDEGLVGMYNAQYLTNGKVHTIYFNSGKVGILTISDSKQSLIDFLTRVYGKVLLS